MWLARLAESCLAIGQLSIALALAVTLLSAAWEVGDVQESPNEAWMAGLFGGIGMFALAFLFYSTNDKWFASCQAQNIDEEEEMNEEHGQEEQGNQDVEHTSEVMP